MHDDQNDDNYISKTQRKRDAEAAQELGLRLVKLNNSQLAGLPLPDELRRAIDDHKHINHNAALRRQMQYIGKLMRNLDLQPIQHALEQLDGMHRESRALHHQIEQWRDRLISDGDNALEELVLQAPQADRHQLRQYIRNAVKEQHENKPPKAARALFRYLRELLTQQG